MFLNIKEIEMGTICAAYVLKTERQGSKILTMPENKFWVSCYHFDTSCAVCTRFIGMVPKNTIADEKRLLYFTSTNECWGREVEAAYILQQSTAEVSTARLPTTYIRTRRLTVASSAVGSSLQQPRGCLMVLIVAAVVFGDLQSRLISIGLQSLPARKGRSLCRL